MSTKIASLYAEVSADTSKLTGGLGNAQRQMYGFARAARVVGTVGDEAKKVEKKVGLVEQSFRYLIRATVAFGAVNLVRNFADIAKEAIWLTAKVDTLGTVVRTLGKNAGYISQDIDQLESSIRANGITMQSTRLALSRMMQSQIDLSHAVDLSRMAQDTAVVSLENSSDSYVRLINVISSGNVRMARQMGIMVSFQRAYEKFAEANDMAVGDISEFQKVQLRTNAVLEAGVQVQGAYTDAMKTAGKQALSTARLWEEYRRELGKAGQEGFGKMVRALNEYLERETQVAIVQRELNQLHKNGVITLAEKGNLWRVFTRELATYPEVLAKIEEWEQRVADSSRQARGAMMLERMALAQLNGFGLGDLDKEIKTITLGMEGVVTKTEGVFEILNTDLGSPMGSFLEDLEWFMATGGRFETTFETIKQAFLEGKISAEEAQTFTEELLVAFYDAKEEVGQLYPSEAISGLASNTKLMWDEATQAIMGTDGMTEALNTVDSIAQDMVGIPGIRDTVGEMRGDFEYLTNNVHDINAVMTILLNYVGQKTPTGSFYSGGNRESQFAEMKAGGGMLSGLDIVGEKGWEYIYKGMVIPHEISKWMAMAGILPSRSFAFGGPIGGGGSGGGTGGAADTPYRFDWYNPQPLYDYGTGVQTSGGGGGGGSTSGVGSLSDTAIVSSVETSVEQAVVSATAGITQATLSSSTKVANNVASQIAEENKADNKKTREVLNEILTVLRDQGTARDIGAEVSSAAERISR